MARIRTIKPSFWSDKKINRLSVFARLLYIGLWNYADDAGRFKAEPRLVKAAVFPLDDSVTNEHVADFLRELANQGHIRLYELDGEIYADIPKFLTHQKISKPSLSQLPEFRECYGRTPVVLRPPSLWEVEVEVEVDMEKEKRLTTPPSAPQLQLEVKQPTATATEKNSPESNNGNGNSAVAGTIGQVLDVVPQTPRPTKHTSDEIWETWNVTCDVLRELGLPEDDVREITSRTRSELTKRAIPKPPIEFFWHWLGVSYQAHQIRQAGTLLQSIAAYVMDWTNKSLDQKKPIWEAKDHFNAVAKRTYMRLQNST